MRRLSGEDSGFLSLELPTQPMHALMLALLRRPSNENGRAQPLTLEGLRAHIVSRLDGLPTFRWRLAKVPLGLYHPVWIEDPDFDLDRHLQRVELPQPGDRAELDRLCAFHAAEPLDRARPLWAIILVDGLADGHQALLMKTHHSLMDGTGLLVTLSRLFSAGSPSDSSADAWRPERFPGRWRMILGASRAYARALRGLPGLVRKIFRGAAQEKRLRNESEISVPRAWVDAPNCSLNHGVTVERAYARTRLSLDDVKIVKDVAGVTVNDVYLAGVSEGLRRYLGARHDLPERSLIANVLVSIEPPDAPLRQSGNRISGLTTSLCTDVDDIWLRLQRIHDVTAESKRLFEAFGPTLITDSLDVLPPWIADLAIRHAHRRRLKRPDRVEYNAVVSNMVGFSSFSSFGPAVLEEVYLSGPPNGSVGVNVSGWSYAGQLLIAAATFKEAMDSPEEFVDGISAGIAELVRRAQELRVRAHQDAGVIAPTTSVEGVESREGRRG